MYAENFTKDVSSTNPLDIKYKRISEIIITATNPPPAKLVYLPNPLKKIVIQGYGSNRRMSIAEVEVMTGNFSD